MTLFKELAALRNLLLLKDDLMLLKDEARKIPFLTDSVSTLNQRLDLLTRQLGFDHGILLQRSGQKSLLIVTIPKSGGTFLENALRELSGNAHLIVGTGYFPNDTLLVERVRLFASGGFIAQQHSDCSPINISLLERYVGRWVVHIRDPR